MAVLLDALEQERQVRKKCISKIERGSPTSVTSSADITLQNVNEAGIRLAL